MTRIESGAECRKMHCKTKRPGLVAVCLHWSSTFVPETRLARPKNREHRDRGRGDPIVNTLYPFPQKRVFNRLVQQTLSPFKPAHKWSKIQRQYKQTYKIQSPTQFERSAHKKFRIMREASTIVDFQNPFFLSQCTTSFANKFFVQKKRLKYFELCGKHCSSISHLLRFPFPLRTNTERRSLIRCPESVTDPHS